MLGALDMDAYRFFRSQGNTAQYARALANAEAEAQQRGWSFTWEWDQDGDLGDHEAWCPQARSERHNRCSHEILGCVLVAADADGRRDYSHALWGIIDPSNAYRREVEAECAIEALAEERARVAAFVAAAEVES